MTKNVFYIFGAVVILLLGFIIYQMRKYNKLESDAYILHNAYQQTQQQLLQAQNPNRHR